LKQVQIQLANLKIRQKILYNQKLERKKVKINDNCQTHVSTIYKLGELGEEAKDG
jgi:hypothetical protein